MSEIRFYHLERQTLDQILPSLLQKAVDGGRRIIVKAANDAHVQQLNDHLWTFHPDSFLPHGSEKDGHAEKQPIWLTSKDENPNGADVLILTHGAETEMLGEFSLCCEIFDGRDETMLAQARTRWKLYKDNGDHELTYWQQGASGWEKKSG